jgi:AcrR family transcriptional regulator
MSGVANDKPRSLWLRKEQAGRGPVPTHDRAGIAAAGIKLADAGGLDAVSMRRVAAAIGAGAASLYRYVETRDELLELMSDTASGQLDLSAPPSGDWRADLLGLAHEIRRVYRLHPWMLEVPPGRVALGPNAVSYLEHALEIMQGVHASGGVKMEVVAMINGLVGLFVRTELAVGANTTAWAQGQAEFLGAVVVAGEHPHLAAAVQDLTPLTEGSDDLIDRVLPRVITGLLATDQVVAAET